METGLAVAHCPRCESRLEPGDLRCPICALAVPKENEPQRPGEAARVVRCGTCGATLEYSAEAKAPRCSFCASVMQVVTQEDPVEQADRFVPFRVEPKAAQAALQAFLARGGFFKPSDVASTATLESLQPLWWPGWSFTAEAQVSWAADSDAGSHHSDWAPHAGASPLTFQDVLVPASKGLTLKECQQLIPRYALSGAAAAPSGPEGTQVERFDVTRSGARKQILTAVEAEAARRMSEAEIPGSRRRNVHVAVVLTSLQTARYALPAYVLAYKYRGKSYRVVVHGQDASLVLGETPISIWKVLLTVGAVLLVLALVLWLVLR